MISGQQGGSACSNSCFNWNLTVAIPESQWHESKQKLKARFICNGLNNWKGFFFAPLPRPWKIAFQLNILHHYESFPFIICTVLVKELKFTCESSYALGEQDALCACCGWFAPKTHVLLGSNCPNKVTQNQEDFSDNSHWSKIPLFLGLKIFFFCLASKEPHVNLNVGKRQFSDSVPQRTFISVFHNFFNSGKLLTSKRLFSFLVQFWSCFWIIFFNREICFLTFPFRGSERSVFTGPDSLHNKPTTSMW